jgi:hypothetical protein
MTIVTLNSQPITSPTPFHFNLHVAATLQIDAAAARRLVNRQVIAKLSTGLAAGEPELTIRGEQLIWRVPVSLSLPELGDLGQVGDIEVNAQTGEILSGAAEREQILQHAHRLYTGSPLPAE